MSKVGNDETLCVGPLALDAHAVSTHAIGIEVACGVYTHVDCTILGLS